MPIFLRFLLCFTLFSSHVSAQILKGRVVDASTGNALVGVNLLLGTERGTTTDLQGNFELSTQGLKLPLVLRTSYVGYESDVRELAVWPGEKITIRLHEKADNLQTVVVTASRFAQQRELSSVSMQVIKPADILASNSVTADDALNRSPGIHVLRGQLNIRGSSGFTFGVGSRVMVLLDGMPILSVESGEMRWNVLPVENVEQMEVIKGAASAMYGSSALGGIVHLRTAMPGDKPVTQVNLFNTFYGPPPAQHANPWEGQAYPVAMGIGLVHRQRFGKLDFSGSLNAVNDDGYRIGEPSRRYRANVNLKYHLAKGWVVGLNASNLIDSTRLYTFWADSSNAYVPAATTTNAQLNYRRFIDPYLEYTGKKTKHSLRNRFYRSHTNFNNEDFGQGDMHFTEYQFQHHLVQQNELRTVLNAGLVRQANFISSDIIYGNQQTVQRAAFVQFDGQYRRLTYGVGFRHEQLVVNGRLKEQHPVFRAGLNYALTPSTFLRSSYGEGFRSPTVAEMFSNTRIGTIRLASDPQLQAEMSQSWEVGILQQFSLGRLKMQLDLAYFNTRYKNMIEYTFAVFLPDKFDEQDSIWIANNDLGRLAEKYARFYPKAIDSATISGFEGIFSGRGQWGKWGLQFQLGYTYTNPINHHPPSSIFGLPNDIMKYLKYRYLHLARTDVQVSYDRWMLGANVRYNSVILNIDEDYYRFIPGLIGYRLNTIRGDLITDLRAGMRLHEGFWLNVVLRNAGNRSFMPVPGNIGEQRSLTLQFQATF